MIRTLWVEVTADDIARGRRDDCRHCPVALAICRALGETPEDDDVWVGHDWVRFDRRGRASVDLSLTVAGFIERFDEAKVVEPFSFALEIQEDA